MRDRARVVRKVQTGARVEGRTPTEEVHGWWQRALFVPGPSPETEDGVQGRRRVIATGTVIFGPDIEVRASDQVDIRSSTVEANGRWRVTGLPEVLRGHRRAHGVSVAVERLVEPEREDIL